MDPSIRGHEKLHASEENCEVNRQLDIGNILLEDRQSSNLPLDLPFAADSPDSPIAEEPEDPLVGYEAGDAKIKPEYLLNVTEKALSLQMKFVSDKDKKKARLIHDDLVAVGTVGEAEPPAKVSKLDIDAISDKLGSKKLSRGRNKKRPQVVLRKDFSERFCPALRDGRDCNFGINCRFLHDPKMYLSKKPPDIGPACYMFDTFGSCPSGITCRFGLSHTTVDGLSIVDESNKCSNNRREYIVGSKEVLNALRKKKYNFKFADEVVKRIYNHSQGEKQSIYEALEETSDDKIGPVLDTDIIRLRSAEKKKIDWKGKLYCAPLTTVGNLPFRRLCKKFGADITCGEMALGTSILQGKREEWAVVRRHPSEDIFGVQVCGSNASSLARCAELIKDHMDVDFVDLNAGCPIDFIYQRGAGSGLLRRKSVLEAIGLSMSEILDVPLTIKMRTGIQMHKNIAHTIIPSLKQWGFSMMTLHGRSREQRYTKMADWEYIHECASSAVPLGLHVFGNGDILSWEDVQRHLSSENALSGVMVARGALIKPWIFTEIKERRHWDISSRERLEILRDYVNYGLEHWGSDNDGVEKTRKFLLEWLSFFHRYIPIGLLEVLPPQINQRPPHYRGRDDLETLMASAHCGDWIKLTEMLLGPVPDEFNFLPKHKANAWG